MKLPIRLLPAARQELDAAVDWYEDQRAGVGAALMTQIRGTFTRISSNPELHPKIYRDLRKAVVAKFPYIVIYRETSTEVLIVSVFHTSRNPSIWKSRVEPGDRGG